MGSVERRPHLAPRAAQAASCAGPLASHDGDRGVLVDVTIDQRTYRGRIMAVLDPRDSDPVRWVLVDISPLVDVLGYAKIVVDERAIARVPV